MVSLDKIQKVMEKIMSVPELSEHVCFFGGAVPYIYNHIESNREHSDIDVLVDENLMSYVRELVKDKAFYKPELDSLNLNLDDDYGFKTFIDDVYVEFEPFTINDGEIIRKSFSPHKQVAGVETIPFLSLDDMIVPFEINGKKSYCQSVEMIKAGKEKYKRDKDIQDIEFIEKHGFDKEKYERVKKCYSISSENIKSYQELQNNNKCV